MVYNTLILPHLQYCCEIWENMKNCRTVDLVLLQKHAVRVLDNGAYRDHTSGVFRQGIQ